MFRLRWHSAPHTPHHSRQFFFCKRYCRGGICPCRQCRRQCKIFASGVNFSIFTHFLCFFLLKLLKLGEIDGVKFLAWKSGGVNFLTNSMSASVLCTSGWKYVLFNPSCTLALPQLHSALLTLVHLSQKSSARHIISSSTDDVVWEEILFS